jgi:asparagine synthase (glutamine-hydrolysing)
MPGETIDNLFQEGIVPPNTGDKIFECWDDLTCLMDDTDELGGLQFLEMRSSLPDELLMYADKLSMAHSLEVRVPYLDKEVVEYVQRLSSGFKVRHGATKWLHRQVCLDFLPPQFLRRTKRGFAVNVVDDWFHSSVNSRMDSIFLDSSSLMYKFLRPGVVERLVKEHISGENDNHKILFSLVVFEEWLRTI